MLRAAELYFEQSLSQQQIARVMECSVATVSRLIAAAQAEGIVRIQIQRRGERVPELAKALCRVFGLREAVVVKSTGTSEGDLKAVGEAAAELLLAVVEPHAKIGVTWGQTLFHMVQALYSHDREPMRMAGVEVLQLSGALGQGNPEIDGPQLALRLADYFGGVCRLVPAPALVDNVELRQMLERQWQVAAALVRASNPDIVIQGIGCLEPALCSLQRAGYLDDVARLAAIEAGAVGHLSARMIDKYGKEIDGFCERVIAVPVAAVRRARTSIGISASTAKVPAVLAAMRAKYFNTIVIDEESSRQVLELERERDKADGEVDRGRSTRR
jgi:dihydroxyacetone kinase